MRSGAFAPGFPGHAVRTVTEAGWRSTKDGSLLSLAESSFDVFVTIDRKLEREFNRGERRLGLIVVINIASNHLEYFLPLFEELREAAESVKPGQVVYVSGSASRRV